MYKGLIFNDFFLQNYGLQHGFKNNTVGVLFSTSLLLVSSAKTFVLPMKNKLVNCSKNKCLAMNNPTVYNQLIPYYS